MHWIDWLIVICPLIIAAVVAVKAQKYVKGVSDFLAAGRVAGRYVVAVASGEASMGLISVVALFELFYNSGFGIGFWNQLSIPIGTVIVLLGYCIYRYRETRAMTMGQFFEMRYNRRFRVFAACLQSFSGVINYAIFPAVGARFLIYFCGLPLKTEMFGMVVPTFALVMAIFLSIAVIIVSMGGQVTIMVTDCIQGILSYPLYAIVVVTLLYQYSYGQDIAPTLLDREPGLSMLNPFDTSKLRDFNLFYIMVGLISNIINRMAWSGTQGYNAAAINAHEQKMGAVLGTWRAGFSVMMITVISICAYTFLNNNKFSDDADLARQELVLKAADDVAKGEQFTEIKTDLNTYMTSGVLSPALKEKVGDVDLNGKEPFLEVAKTALLSEDKSTGQSFSAIYGQMRVPTALRHMLPMGVMGVFCALCIFLMISTDTTYMHSWGSIIVQDIVLPIRGRPFTPKQQLRLLRLVIAGVAVFAFLFSFFFAQVDFILMFFAITGAIWMGGAGPCIVGGLYWSRATPAGAFASLIAGSSLAVSGIIIQKLWTPTIYPWLSESALLPQFTAIIERASRPLEPIIQWRVGPDKFPINSQEIFFMTMLVSVTLYISISLLTSKKPFNMERMLHRGKYRKAGEKIVTKPKWSWATAFQKIIGIDSQYTRGDKILAYSVITYNLSWAFGSFVVLCIWNAIAPWPDQWWANWFQIYFLIVPAIIAVISTVWFSIGGTLDLRKMFHRLAEKHTNTLDDGSVIGHVSADDVAIMDAIDHDKK